MLLFEYNNNESEESESIIPILVQSIVVMSSSWANFFITLWVERKSPFEPQSAFGYVRIVRNPLSLINVTVGAFVKVIAYFIGATVVIILFFLGCKQYSLLGYLTIFVIFFLSHKFLILIDQFFEGEEISRKQLIIMRNDGVFFQKERALTFADGIFAIAGTIVAVNLRPPELEEGEKLIHGLYGMLPQFLSYFMSFLLLAFWWFINWRMMNKVPERVPILIHVLNLEFLCLVGALPAAESISVFSGEASNSDAITLYCIVVFIAGILQTISWILILRLKRSNVSKRYKYLIFSGIAIGPITAIPSYILSYFDECVYCLDFASVAFVFVPVIGVAIYLLSSNKVEKKTESESETL